MIESLVNLLSKVQTWEFIAIILLSIGSCITLLFSFIPKQKLQRVSLQFFLAGAFLWLSIILFQAGPLTISEIEKIGWIYFIFSISGLIFALYAGWMWIKKNKHVWLVCMITGIAAMVFFCFGKKLKQTVILIFLRK